LAVALIDEQRPAKGSPLKPSSVVAAFASSMGRYGCRSLVADGHYREAVAEHLEAHALSLEASPEGADGKSEMFVAVRTALHEGRLELPDHPRLLAQLRAVVAKPLPGGGLAISSPRSATGGHGDIVSALCAAVHAATLGSVWARNSFANDFRAVARIGRAQDLGSSVRATPRAREVVEPSDNVCSGWFPKGLGGRRDDGAPAPTADQIDRTLGRGRWGR
jgi:hypothetical protein